MDWSSTSNTVLCVLLSAALVKGRREQRCREPVLERYQHFPQEHESFQMLRNNCQNKLIERCIYSPTNKSVTKDVDAFIKIRNWSLPSNINGPAHKQCTWQTGNGYLSMCPHHYVINYDTNRRPKRILEAKCNCNLEKRCLNGNKHSRCVPVKYYTNVLRKSGCDSKRQKFTYKHVIEAITVGCTCAYQPNKSSQQLVQRYFSEE